MERNIKIKVGGGKIKWGSAELNDFHGWTGVSDQITWRELKKSPNRIARKVLKEVYGISNYSDWNLLGYKNLEESSYLSSVIPETISIKHKPLDLYNTGEYQLEYGGQTTRKLKYYLPPADIQEAIDEDFGQNYFNVTSLRIEDNLFGPYEFEAVSVGEKDFIKLSQDVTPISLSGSLTGYKGSSTTKSVQALYVHAPDHNLNYEVELENLDSDTTYYYKHTHWFKSLDGPWDTSGTSYQSLSKSTSHTIPVSVSTHIDPSGFDSNLIVAPMFFDISKGEENFIHSIGHKTTHQNNSVIDPLNQEAHIKVTGLETGKGYKTHKREFFNHDSLSINTDSSSYDNSYFFVGGPSYFTGSKYIRFNEVNVTNCTSLEFVKLADDAYSDFEKVSFSGCSNLTGFQLNECPNITGINLNGCSIKSLNSTTQSIPDPTGNICSDFSFISASGVDLNGNDLDEVGCNTVLSYLSTTPVQGGHLDIRNQQNFNNLNAYQDITGFISTLSGKNWEVLYDK